MAPPLSSPAASAAAHASFASSLVPDLPLLLHGSGDVEPSDVDPETVAILADLTATFVSRLVDAAVDAHDVLTDGAGGIRPPPPYPEPDRAKDRRGPSSSLAGKERSKRKRKKGDEAAPPKPGGPDDFWDELPVPEPKVKQRRKKESVAVEDSATDGGSATTTTAATAQQQEQQQLQDAPVSPDEWIGLAGVDLFRPRRRAPFASPPTTIETKCFIYPICHDAALYGRVMEIQMARRIVEPVLLDPIWMNMVETEGRHVIRAMEAGRAPGAPPVGEGLSSGTATAGGGSSGSGEGDAADADADRAAGLRRGPGDGAIWPGLEMLLPTHRSDD